MNWSRGHQIRLYKPLSYEVTSFTMFSNVQFYIHSLPLKAICIVVHWSVIQVPCLSFDHPFL
jgi:hypothetical protein